MYPSKHIFVAVCGPIGTKFGTHMHIRLEKVVGKIKNGWPDWHHLWCTHADSSRKGSWPKHFLAGGLGLGGGGGGSEIQKSEKAHVNTHAYSSTKGSRPIGRVGVGGQGGGGVGGQKFKSQKKHM